MKVQVERVMIPAGSTIGFVFGRISSDQTKVAVGAADWRSAMALGEKIERDQEPFEVEMPDSAILEILEDPR